MAASRDFNAYYDSAERLYVEERKAYKEIALLLPPTEATLREWGRKHHWETKRETYQTSPGRIVRRLRCGIATLSNRHAEEWDAGTADAIYKLEKVVERYVKVSEEHFLEKAIQVASRLSDFIRSKFQDDYQRRSEYSDFLAEFLQQIEMEAEENA